jgi:hypothetical protein
LAKGTASTLSPLSDPSVDALVLRNVLEHIEDDRAAGQLRPLQSLRPGVVEFRAISDAPT